MTRPADFDGRNRGINRMPGELYIGSIVCVRYLSGEWYGVNYIK